MVMKKLLLSLAVLATSVAGAQDFLGYSASEYAGVTAIDIQPANLADNRFRFDMTLFGFSMKAYNNYVGIKRYGLKGLRSGYPAMADSTLTGNQMQTNYLETYDGGRNKSVYLSNRLVLPSFLIEINHKNSLAFTWDVRNYVNVDGVTPELAKLIYNDYKVPSLWPQQLKATNLSIQAMSWAEYGVTYARVLKEDNEHAFKAAGRVKIMQGLAAAYMFAKDFSFQFPTDSTMNIFNTSVDYGHSNNLYVSDAGQLGYKFVSNPGVGFDLGGVYEWRPEYEKYKYDMDNETGLWRRDKSKYKVKVGLSILDIGGVKFRKGEYSNNFKANVNVWEIRKLKFDSIPIKAFDDTLRARFPAENTKSTFVMNLPTAISAQADYKIWGDFDVNLIMYYAFQFKNNPNKVHDFSSISITPAWDHKWFGVFIPVQYHALYGFTYGTCLRLGPIIIGTDNMRAIFGGKSFTGGDIYALVKIPIPFGPPRDKDKDKVSNKKDKCKEVPGVWEFMGCPDTDGDHIPDSEDKCPTVAGLKELKGCPDRDSDGITDLDDACPDEKGLAEFKGCPDRDGDKIIDSSDECPDDAGLAEYMGCPDRDGDKVIDKLDLCPDVPGPVEFKGCPDKDGDSVLDKDDACPDVEGPAENKGCPWPDSDKDGVADREDDCPGTPGLKELKGCPPIKPEEQKVIEKAFANLEFATGKDIIKKTSYPSLNDLAKLLKQHGGEWTLKLSGHTDNQGTPEKNMLLSEKRAKAVKKYLVAKGVKGDKVIAEWFGQTKPIDSNDTEAGRQRNRRVEMKIIFK
jgi:outer membrane protein OmpA-like peptidoglycan-associated protein